MKKQFLLPLLIILIPLMSASLYLELDWIKVEQGSCFNIFESCDNCSYINITVLFSNGTVIVANEAMTNLSSRYYYNYTFCDTNTLGVYPIIINYDEDGFYLES